MLYLKSFLPMALLALASLASAATRRRIAPRWAGEPDCSAAVNGLIAGVEINILAQQGERNASEALQTIESASPVNMTLFAAGQAVLVSDIMFGMTIRKYNQLIAPAGNAALPGLAKYAAAQATELGLAQSLNGVPAHDAPILAMLVSDVTTGIHLNQNNTRAAATGCYSPLLQYLPVVVADDV